METQQSEAVINIIWAQTSKPEPAQYLHAVLFGPTKKNIFKTIKKGFPKTWPGLTKKIIKRHLKK